MKHLNLNLKCWLVYFSFVPLCFAQAQSVSSNAAVFVSNEYSVEQITDFLYADTSAKPLSKAITHRGLLPQEQDKRCLSKELDTQVNSTTDYANQQNARSKKNADQFIPVVDKPVSSINLALNFASDSDKLPDQELNALKKVADAMNEVQLKKVVFAVIGHTDNSGTRNYNLELSCSRAYAVSQHLIKLGVDSSRIAIYGFGPDQPLGKSPNSNLKNRRVEIRRAN